MGMIRMNNADNSKKEDVHEIDLDSLVVESGESKPTLCRLCGALLDYSGLGEYVCPDCGHVEYDTYGVVRAYLEKFPGSNVVQIERATGVPRHKINKLISDGRFNVTEGMLKAEQDRSEEKVSKKGVYVNNGGIDASRMWSKDIRS